MNFLLEDDFAISIFKTKKPLLFRVTSLIVHSSQYPPVDNVCFLGFLFPSWFSNLEYDGVLLPLHSSCPRTKQTFILQISEFAPKWEGIFFHPCRKPWPFCFDYRILSTSEYHLWAESDQYSSYRLRVEIPRVSPGTHFLLGNHFGASH